MARNKITIPLLDKISDFSEKVRLDYLLSDINPTTSQLDLNFDWFYLSFMIYTIHFKFDVWLFLIGLKTNNKELI